MKWSRNSLERQCALAARLGCDGIEIAPFTLGEEPHLLPAAQRTVLRRAAADAGIAIISLTSSTARARGLVLSRIRSRGAVSYGNASARRGHDPAGLSARAGTAVCTSAGSERPTAYIR
jgi:hypothetical protein